MTPLSGHTVTVTHKLRTSGLETLNVYGAKAQGLAVHLMLVVDGPA